MKSVLIVIATLCFLSIPSTALACSCATGDPPYEFNRTKAVFIGRMLAGTEKLTAKDQNGKSGSIEAGKVSFTVEEVFKGDVADEVTIEIASHVGTSCGPYGLKRGERYLVYAYASERNEKILYSGVCTRTTTVSSKYAKEDLDFLRNLPPPGLGGNLRGRIWADLKSARATPLPFVKVNIRGAEGQLITASTDNDGNFEVRQLKPGKYKVEPEFPLNYSSEHKSHEVTVDDRGTADVGFEAYINGRVLGRVVDNEGRAFNDIFLHLVGKGKTVYGHSTGEDGAFEVTGVPPGEYTLYLEMRSADYEKNKFYYYPGTFRREEARAVSVGLGEKIEGLEFHLPDGFKVRTVEGQVVWKDGRPAAEVDVMLLCPRTASPDGLVIEFMPSTTRTDEQGRFRLEGFTGETYWIEARGASESSKKDSYIEMHSASRKLTLSEDLTKIKLVLSEGGLFGSACEK